MRGRRKGDEDWQEVVWTIERAGQLGLTTKDQWKKQPQTMLVARATGELCRLVAADALSAVPYAAEEDDRPAVPVKATVTRVTAGAGITRVTIVLNYRHGLGVAPLKQ